MTHDDILYALAKQLPAMARGFTIRTDYGELRLDAEDAAPIIQTLRRVLERKAKHQRGH